MSDGYYSSKKTDDICKEICGQVQIPYQFCTCSIFKLLTSLLKILGYLKWVSLVIGKRFFISGITRKWVCFFPLFCLVYLLKFLLVSSICLSQLTLLFSVLCLYSYFLQIKFSFGVCFWRFSVMGISQYLWFYLIKDKKIGILLTI